MARRISLRGLQIGEEIFISTCGLIQRKDQVFNAGSVDRPEDARLDASALCRGPEQVMYVAELLNQFLRAMGEPFELRYKMTRREKGTHHTKVDKIFRELFKERARIVGDSDNSELSKKSPKIARYEERDGYFCAVFEVISANN